MAEYSRKKPATSSDSPSGRSKGERFVSARMETKKITNMGSSGTANQTVFCASTISVRFSDPTQMSTVMMTKPMDTSYETICAAERRAPRNGYFELDAQPAMMTP